MNDISGKSTEPAVTVTDTLIAHGHLDDEGKFVPAEGEEATGVSTVTYVQDGEDASQD